MANNLIQSISDGISVAINKYHPDAEIFDESIQQELNPPGYYIGHVQTVSNQMVGSRFRRIDAFDIHYFGNGAESELLAVADTLSKALDVITITHWGETSRLRGVNMSWSIVSDVLHFLVSYSYHAAYEMAREENMDNVNIGETVKEG